jgi:hypothetical protein
MKTLQHGLGTFGVLVVLVIAGAGGWWVYKNVFEADTVSAPSCQSQLASCMANCRKTSTEAAQSQACQEGCRANLASCEAPKR